MKNLFGIEHIEYKRFGDMDIDWKLLEEDLYILGIYLYEYSKITNCIFKNKKEKIGGCINTDNLKKIKIEIKEIGLVNANEIFITKKDFLKFKKMRKEVEV